jgi:hypothetical protein
MEVEMAAKQSRVFAQDEKLVVKKKSRLYDKDRKQEGIQSAKDSPPPALDMDVTGISGRVCGETYHNPTRDEYMVPIRLENDAVISVPEDRLERESPSSPSVEKDEIRAMDGGGGVGGVSPDTIDFWRKYFENEDKAKRLDELEKKG